MNPIPTLTAALMIALAATAIATADDPGHGRITGTAIVIDGDTIEVRGTRIRLWGIDSPERGTMDGRRATQTLRTILENRTVTCHDHGTRTYGRMVAQCYIAFPDGLDDGEDPDLVDIAAVMVLVGRARDWPKYSDGHYSRGNQ